MQLIIKNILIKSIIILLSLNFYGTAAYDSNSIIEEKFNDIVSGTYYTCDLGNLSQGEKLFIQVQSDSWLPWAITIYKINIDKIKIEKVKEWWGRDKVVVNDVSTEMNGPGHYYILLSTKENAGVSLSKGAIQIDVGGFGWPTKWDLYVELKYEPTEEQIKLFENAQELYDNEKYDKALIYYNKSIDINPKYKMAWYKKGQSHYELGEFDLAIQSFDEVIEIDPEYKRVWIKKGLAHRALGDFKSAVDSYDKAIEIDPENIDAWYNKGSAYQALGEFSDAIDSYEKAIEINQDDENAWHRKGESLHNLGKYEDAIEAFGQAIDIDPESAELWASMGNSLFSLGRYNESLYCYDKAIALNPDLVDAWEGKGEVVKTLFAMKRLNLSQAYAILSSY